MATTMLSTARPGPGLDTPARGLRPLLAPRSVAVTGAMRRLGNAGHELVRALRDYRFRGRLYPVHDSGRPVCGVPGYRTIADLPAPADLLVVAAGGDDAVRAIRAAGRRGVGGAVVLSGAGREVVMAARQSGVYLIGPGSIGLLNTDPQVRLNATLARTRPSRGGLALASQSGAVGVALLEHVSRNGCGVASFVSAGEGRDLDFPGLADYWRHDPRTRAVALFPDRPDDLGQFAEQARALSLHTPILMVGGGSADSVVAGARLADAGVILTTGLDEMVDAARILVGRPLPAGNRLAVVGNAGALMTIAVETARAYGLTEPPGAGPAPVDLGPQAGPAAIAEAVDAVAGNSEVDIVLAVVVGTHTNCPTAIMNALADVLDQRPDLTAAVVLAGSADDIHRTGIREIPVYRQQDRAVRALAHAHRYAVWRRGPGHVRSRRRRG
ncbi:CoA-binding protein [Paractinoplanes ovalisporus]|nr:CoA-binding protein [Actinoplanes ovalisporus]